MLIQKTVYGFNYWWNVRDKVWEGLRQNATDMDGVTFNHWWQKLQEPGKNVLFAKIKQDAN
jgi:hypothetical protein